MHPLIFHTNCDLSGKRNYFVQLELEIIKGLYPLIHFILILFY